jgi:autotransporter-associated beta strand protein
VATDEDPDGGGGTLAVSYLERSYGCSGTLNFHGGTLKARVANADFLKRTFNYVYEEGAVIDTDGKDVTVTSVLATPGGQGVTGITLGSAGSGYTAPPVVVLSDSSATPGTGATAIAKVTGGGVQVVMTNPGVGYTDPSTVAVTLYGGDGSGAELGLGAVTLADNVCGGLTKKGLGTLTLSAANTYTGATAVQVGTLALASTGSITSDVTVSGGATLGGAGTVTGDVAVSGGGTIAPGASAGKLTVAGDLDLGATANVTWELGTLTDDGTGVAGADFDQILLKSGDLDLGTAAQLTLKFDLLAPGDQPTADPLNTFWETSHAWKVIDVDADNSGTNLDGTNFKTIAFSGTTPSKVVFNTSVGTTDGTDLGDIYLNCAPGSPVSVPGDANGDGKVDATDATALATNWGTTTGATWKMGDFTGEGAVNAADASILAANWGYGAEEGNAVPEPSMLALLLAGLAVLGLRRRVG